MKPSSLQQVLVGLAVVLVIMATLLGGVILALGDSARTGVSASRATATPYPIATHTSRPTTVTGTSDVTVVVIPSSTPSDDPKITETLALTRTPIPTIAFPTARATSQPRTPTPAPPATVTPTPATTGTQTATDGACTNGDSLITSPHVGTVLRGAVALYGSARLPNFSFYKLEIRPEGTSTSTGFVTFYTAATQVTSGLLATLDTRAFVDGEYWIRLVVVDTTGNYPERCSILYVFDN